MPGNPVTPPTRCSTHSFIVATPQGPKPGPGAIVPRPVTVVSREVKYKKECLHTLPLLQPSALVHFTSLLYSESWAWACSLRFGCPHVARVGVMVASAAVVGCDSAVILAPTLRSCAKQSKIRHHGKHVARFVPNDNLNSHSRHSSSLDLFPPSLHCRWADASFRAPYAKLHFSCFIIKSMTSLPAEQPKK